LENINLPSDFELRDVEEALKSAGYELKDYQEATIAFGMIGVPLEYLEGKTITHCLMMLKKGILNTKML
jgi:hypothetical protein